MITINRVRNLVISIGTKAMNIHTIIANNKRLKVTNGNEMGDFDKVYEDIYEHALFKVVENGDFSYEAYYDEDLKVHLVKLVDFMIEAIDISAFTSPNLMIPVRTPILVANIKKLRLPKYMIYTILILGSQSLPAAKVPKSLNAKKIERMANYVRKTLDDKLHKPRLNHIWCRQALCEYRNCNRFSHATHADSMKCYNACIMLGLHKIDAGSSFKFRRSEQGKSEMEFKRRIFWMTYLGASILFGIFKQTFYGGLCKSANRLPQNDYEWRNAIMHVGSNPLATVENKELIRTSESRRINTDITRIKCIVFAIHNRATSFRNQRSSFVKKDYQLDFNKYTVISKQVNKVTKMLKMYTFDTLQKLKLCENANFLLIDETSVKCLLFQLWNLHVVLLNAATQLCLTEISLLPYFANEPWRVQIAKMLCVDYALEGIRILRWGVNNIPAAHMDLNIYIIVHWLMYPLLNAATVRDHPNYSQVVEGKEFLLQLLTSTEPKLQNKGMFHEYFNHLTTTKERIHEANKIVESVPNIILSTAITDNDINPWFTVGTPASTGYVCCLLSSPAVALRCMLLTYYMDYSSTSVDFIESLCFLDNSALHNIIIEHVYENFLFSNNKSNTQKYKKMDTFITRNKDKDMYGGSSRVQISNLLSKPSKNALSLNDNTAAFVSSFFRLIFPNPRLIGSSTD
ncbi:hypothetical protein AX774_g3272 [Zancudomyces culisetae]|uniref:Transcription factor domain-containing protein n=1 Tax=Zancudomyces culisetae TaxID=1213189 RepID=A0A1R1PQG0_ZANCU|nr:hypothetical protein AX774_g3272 [Zancudomyces culisetae]|eukprot:OMH83226.1 hypothetical protein AX774_g3272 [Zancudomyces culisetae]